MDPNPNNGAEHGAFNDVAVADRIVQAQAASGELLGYEIGARYPRFGGVSRALVRDIFDRGGFTKVVEGLDRLLEPQAALTEAVSRFALATVNEVVRAAKAAGDDGVKLVIRELEAADDHGRAWGVYREDRAAGERGSRIGIGARLWVSPAGIGAAAPVDAPSDRWCREVAERLVRRAAWLQQNASTPCVSSAVTGACREAGALAWLNKGAYMALAGNASTERLVAALGELRGVAYDPVKRAGVRVSVLPLRSGDERSTTAVVDAVVDDAEAKVSALVKGLRGRQGRARNRASALESARDEAAAVLAGLDEHASLLGPAMKRIAEMAEAVRAAYAAAVEGEELTLDESIDAELGGDDDALPPGSAPPAVEAQPADPVAEAAPAARPARARGGRGRRPLRAPLNCTTPRAERAGGGTDRQPTDPLEIT